MIAMTAATNLRVPPNVRRFAFPATIVFAIGTGGDYTPDYLRILDAKIIVGPAKGGDATPNPDNSVDVASAAKDLGYIRSVLKITTSDLARTLKVSRQSLYNWKAGSYIKPHNISKLENLKLAANSFVQAKFTVQPSMLDLKLPGGKSLLEQIASDGDGAAAAVALMNVVTAEAAQRRTLDDLLADSISRKPDVVDYGAPAFREE